MAVYTENDEISPGVLGALEDLDVILPPHDGNLGFHDFAEGKRGYLIEQSDASFSLVLLDNCMWPIIIDHMEYLDPGNSLMGEHQCPLQGPIRSLREVRRYEKIFFMIDLQLQRILCRGG